jgi:hypothetical protein
MHLRLAIGRMAVLPRASIAPVAWLTVTGNRANTDPNGKDPSSVASTSEFRLVLPSFT